MLKIDTMQGHERMSTQALLMAIREAVGAGESEFEIAASGQHDIGGPLWHPEGKALHFQRAGSMCMPGTEIVIEGSASADVGWLNAGGRITVLGDAGDTAGHCSSGGRIYIGGRAGTRSGSLMKHDPLYEAPELWILKNTGSFSFEFMGGGKAVVCGYDSEGFPSVLGERPCVGMVGGVVYARGPVGRVPATIGIRDLDEEDKAFLAGGLADFLEAVGEVGLYDGLADWSQWKKLQPLAASAAPTGGEPPIRAFRRHEWIAGGLFSDVSRDDYAVHPILNTGLYRLRTPSWDNRKYAAPCEWGCPVGIPTQERYGLIRQGKMAEAVQLVLDYTPFPGSVCGALCPNPCMDACTRGTIDAPVQIGGLGYASAFVKVEPPAVRTGKEIAVIGGGGAGLSAAWHLARQGHSVTVYDDAARPGGKMEQVIPRARLSSDLLAGELARIESVGVKFVTGCRVTREKFAALRRESDAVIVATGGHKSRYFPWEGVEHLTMGLDFLKRINRGEKPKAGRRVVVIGCGNSGMDTCRGAYEMGAESVVAVDVQKPAAFDHEIAYIESLGGRLVWPFVTKKITAEGVYSEDGRFLPADQVIVSIGEEPVTDFLPEDEGIERFRGAWLVGKADHSILPGVFTAGDVIKPGRLTDAIGDGLRAARSVHRYVMGGEALAAGEASGGLEGLEAPPEKAKIPARCLGKAYFLKCHPGELGDPVTDDARCVSCGACRDCRMCLESCPGKAISRIERKPGEWEYVSDPDRCIGCGICAGVCPCGVWSLSDNPEPIPMYSTGSKF